MPAAPPTVKVVVLAQPHLRQGNGNPPRPEGLDMHGNGIDLDQLAALGEVVTASPDAAAVSARVRTDWERGYSVRTDTDELICGGERISRDATLPADLPRPLGGEDRGPAPGRWSSPRSARV